MATRLTVTLPDEVYERIQHLARLAGRAVPDMVVDTLQASLPPIGSLSSREVQLEGLSDAQVLTLAGSGMDPQQDAALSALLHKQQAGILTEVEDARLHGLMQRYQEALLLKARALREAVRRGIMEPLTT